MKLNAVEKAVINNPAPAAAGDRWVERFFGDFVIGVAVKSTSIEDGTGPAS